MVITNKNGCNAGRSMFMQKELSKEDEGNGMVKESFMIGSRPPRCKGICLNCGPCEAVQVPATPQERKSVGHSNVNINGRGDESSNYKPMNWKCKCGKFIFNP
ncbi:EPIDERMAL PATTERNING FACTOR-like protein 2 [Dendrobium catenatum]|uniref:EPIDERMAL PATTERNING FACTOR-like protein 2 n=1 Tax=Dendrobium catenatum TaxID=906689 RepID=UPI00109F45B5|nr:EPIDERMAL PATTERNING FACTOR-like protein 2 [Dendrobium catenatum]